MKDGVRGWGTHKLDSLILVGSIKADNLKPVR